MDKWNKSSSSSRICSGLVILVIGLVFLLRNFGLYIPGWIFTWPMLLIAIGLLIGFKRDFKGVGWLVMVLIGGSFLVGDIWGQEVSKYYFGGALIVAGLYMILGPKSVDCKGKGFSKRWERKFEKKADWKAAEKESYAASYANADKNDILESVSVFGGSHQHIHSKNFKGGEAIAVFGGCDVNLTQADFEGTIELDVVALFGGVKIIVPPSWEVKSEVVAIFGGLDDKRSLGPVSTEPRKILKIQGVTIFGGVEIRNF
jgi:predicted membrane protein